MVEVESSIRISGKARLAYNAMVYESKSYTIGLLPWPHFILIIVNCGSGPGVVQTGQVFMFCT